MRILSITLIILLALFFAYNLLIPVINIITPIYTENEIKTSIFGDIYIVGISSMILLIGVFTKKTCYEQNTDDNR